MIQGIPSENVKTEHGWKLERDPILLIDDVARLTGIHFDRWARSYHLTRAQCVALKRLRDQPGAIQKELASLREVEPITISRQLDKLELLGLIERRLDVKDRRIRRVHILPDGEKLLALVECYCDQFGNFLIGDLSTTECESLMAAVLHMKSKLVVDGAPTQWRNTPDRRLKPKID